MEWEPSSSGIDVTGGGGGDVAGTGNLMTEEQILVLRKQISIYGTLSQQLADIHVAHSRTHHHRSGSSSSASAGASLGALYGCDPTIIRMGHGAGGGGGGDKSRFAARQRWTPTQKQLAILEGIFGEGHGTPTKQRIVDITAELSQHGNISEASVYNWFQNRRARWRRRRQHQPTATAAPPSSLPTTICNAAAPSDCSNAEPEAAKMAATSSADTPPLMNHQMFAGSRISDDWTHAYFFDSSIDHLADADPRI